MYLKNLTKIESLEKNSIINVTSNRHLAPYAGQDGDFKKSKFHDTVRRENERN